MLSNRVLGFLLLLIIIPVGIVAVSRYLPAASRRDTITPSTYIIPWMHPNSSLGFLRDIPAPNQPWNIDSAMAGALRLDMMFTISLPNSVRSIPSTVFLGHDSSYLYVGGFFQGMYSNPYSNVSILYANYFQILLDSDNDGKLTSPESGSYLEAAVPCPYVPSQCYALGSDGWGTSISWEYIDETWRDQTYLGRGLWDFAQNVCQQPFTEGASILEYNNRTGTLAMIFSRSLAQSGSCADGLQMRQGERWVMGFLLELGFLNPSGVYNDMVDGWPQKAYPFPNNDASWWPKLSIDIANPPPQF